MFNFKFEKSDLYFALAYFSVDILTVLLETIGNLPTFYAPTFGLAAAYAAAAGLRAIPILILCGLFIHAPILILHLKSISLMGILVLVISVTSTAIMFGYVFSKFFFDKVKPKNFLHNFSYLFSKFLILSLACCLPIFILSFVSISYLSNYTAWQAFLTSARYAFGVFAGIIIMAPVLTLFFNKSYKSHVSFHHIVTYALSIFITTGVMFFVEIHNVVHLKNNFNRWSKVIETRNRKKILYTVDQLRLLRNNVYLTSKSKENSLLRDYYRKYSNQSFIKSLFIASPLKPNENHDNYKISYSYPHAKGKPVLDNKISIRKDYFSKLTGLISPTSKDSNEVMIFFPYERNQQGVATPYLIGMIIDFDQFLQQSYQNSTNPNLQLFSIKFTSVFKLNGKRISRTFIKKSNSNNASKAKAFKYKSKFEYLNLSVYMSSSMPPVQWKTVDNWNYWLLLVGTLLLHIALTRIQFYLMMKDVELNELNLTLESRIKERTDLLSKRTKEIESLFKVIPDALFTIDKNAHVVKFKTNSMQQNVSSNIFYKNKSFLDYLKSVDKVKFYNLLSNSIESNDVVTDVFEFFERNNVHYFEFTFAKYTEDSALIMARDVTDKHKLQKHIELQNIQALSHAKLASLGEMAAGIAHEINNPLTIIDGSAQVLEKLIEKENGLEKEKIIKSLQRISKTVTRIASIVNGLKKFTYENKNETERVLLSSFLDESLSFCRERFANQGINLSLEIKTKQRFIYCNPIELSQVIVNLLNNAFDAIKDNEDKWVKVIVTENGKFLVIKIVDSGRGISDSIQNKIMQPFYTTKAIGQGTGLGLSISQGIVKTHNGLLTYEKYLGHTCFKLTLPKANTQAAAVS